MVRRALRVWVVGGVLGSLVAAGLSVVPWRPNMAHAATMTGAPSPIVSKPTSVIPRPFTGGQLLPTPASSQVGFGPGSVELPSLRSERAGIYQNPDGSRTNVVSDHRVHFKDASGAWQNLDPSLVQAGQGHLAETANSIGVQVATSPSDPTLGSVQLDPAHMVAFSLAGASGPAGSVARRQMNFAAVLPSTTMELAAIPEGLKETLVLSSPAAPDTFVFPLSLTGLSASVDATSGTVDYKDSSGKVWAITPPGVVTDTPADPTKSAGMSSNAVSYSVIALPTGRQALQVKLDRGWLSDPARN